MIWAGINKLHVVLITLITVWISDRLSKTWVLEYLNSELRGASEGSHPAWLVVGQSPGAVFGWMATWPGLGRSAVFAVAAVLLAWLAFSFYRTLAPGDRLNALALGLLVGGGLGNLTDRLRDGYTMDFIRLTGWSSDSGSVTAFNLADLFIVLGVAILLLELLASEGVSRVVANSRADSQTSVPANVILEPHKESGREKKNTSP